MQTELSVREQQKQDRRQRIFEAAMRLYKEQGFHETTVLDIAKHADVSRGTVFNYYPYKEAILVEYFAGTLQELECEVAKRADENVSPIDSIYLIFEGLAEFVALNKELVLPLSFELLNPDPERSKRAFISLPLANILKEYLTSAREQGLIRQDYSRERLARTIANTYFLTALQWAVYRQDRSIHEELYKALKIALEGITAR